MDSLPVGTPVRHLNVSTLRGRVVSAPEDTVPGLVYVEWDRPEKERDTFYYDFSREGAPRVDIDYGPHGYAPEVIAPLPIIEMVATLEPPEFTRAGGDTTCPICARVYYDHPRDRSPAAAGYDGSAPLTILCDGRRVKL